MKIVIPGGSGQLGSRLSSALAADGYEVVVLSRGADAGGAVRTVHWDAESPGEWAAELDGASCFEFSSPSWPEAADDLCREWRRLHRESRARAG